MYWIEPCIWKCMLNIVFFYHVQLIALLSNTRKKFRWNDMDKSMLPHIVLIHENCCDLLSPRNSVGGDIVTRPFVGGWVSEWVCEWVGSCVGACVSGSVTLYLVDTIATTVFAQSLSNFTWTFTMMRGGSLLILGHGVKGQGQLWHSVYNTLWTRYLVDTIATTVFAQSLSNFTWTFTMMRGGTLLILGHGVKGQGQLWHSVYKTLWTQ